jgi:PBP1b-binding outer membrane lipoprotein LpoB
VKLRGASIILAAVLASCSGGTAAKESEKPTLKKVQPPAVQAPPVTQGALVDGGIPLAGPPGIAMLSSRMFYNERQIIRHAQ